MQRRQIEEKLEKLRALLQKLETEGMENIRQKRILADMDDDFRENEGAKLVMEDHEFLHLRVFRLKKEILELKKALFKLRK
ncbi:hypothetical protein A2397_03965 [Candidatus Amesbacteria bacterium RIFOXYB1_FULL_44_23]|uniref:Transcription elongation factor GreA/GreB N-terminal domain-containing protein n=1 Tax=Candidatus Amesbacteria bacterium RIFOXYB1_FULL_44_23 TaxID=1797263 RepID=A0A1F4ZVS1_9BACT|nr:MAG: hypothetical protein A2397_03965 [Candidatus Amesbacteria bacterium RIFOXYB1_FULL_44_23]